MMSSLTRTFRTRSLGALICYAIAIGISLYCWGPLTHAKWGLIDDHEIMHFIGTHERLPLSHVVPVLKDSELSSTSTLQRFRPSYYILRTTEATFWGKNASLWYAFRIAIALFLAITLAYFGARFAGPIVTVGFLVFVITQPYWADIFARAGPAEVYAVLGISLIALAWGARFRTEVGTPTAFLILLGILIAGGTKENFVILAILPLWLLFSRRVRTTPAGKLMFVGAIAFLAWIAVTVAHRLQQKGTDVYANDVSLTSRLKVAVQFFALPSVQYWIAGLLLLVVLGALLGIIAKSNSDARVASLARSMNGCLFAAFGLLALYGIQYVFYDGKWPDNAQPRYLFPGIPAFHAAILIGCVALVNLVKTSNASKTLVFTLQLVLSLGFIAGSVNNVETNRNASLQTVRNTNSFEEKFQAMADYLAQNPSMPVILNTHSVWDGEPMDSITRFMRARGLTNPVAVRIVGYSPAQFAPGSMEKSLAEEIETPRGPLKEMRAVPIQSVSQTDCYSVGLSGPPLDTCKRSVVMWPYSP